jgi:hypothetical protein
LEIRLGTRRTVVLETGSLRAPIEQFDKCARESLRDWGVDLAVEDKIVLRPWPTDPNLGLTSADYPKKPNDRGEESSIKLRLLIDAAGKPTSCTTTTHFRAPEFPRAVCAKVLERARFEPAELADGTKVPSYYLRRIIFQLDH